ncbi:MAG: 50S ribosomal protein L17 [Parachlamydiales bacterium]|jgi:large subunit ribosomal protein L17
MRHLKGRAKLGKTGAHKRCMFANMLKSLIDCERIETTLAKGKELKKYADKIITLAKKDDIAAKRLVKSRLMIRYNTLTSKEKKEVKLKNDLSSYNTDRKVIKKLFTDLKERYLQRNGGYTRIIIGDKVRVGDGSTKCFVEYIK